MNPFSQTLLKFLISPPHPKAGGGACHAEVNGSVSYAYCQCPAGKVGTCSHIFAVMKLVAEWAIGKLTKIPEMKACTSKPCTWSVLQRRGTLIKSPISEILLISAASKKQKTSDENATPKGIK